VTFVPGLRVGHATDATVKTGVTVFLADQPAIAAVHVAGGAPASRETDLLRPGNLVSRVDAIVLSGGSAFGLSTADGVMAWLAEHGRGYAVGEARVPIVPGACLFDLLNGGAKPATRALGSFYAGLGRAACEAASEAPALGSVGAGTGATTADLKGGFGMAGMVLPDGATVGAFAAVNAVGRVTVGSSPYFRAAAFERDGEFGGLGLPVPLPPDAVEIVVKRRFEAQTSTTLCLVATDCDLTSGEAHRLAVAAHDGFALAVFPAHTPFDGDTVFTLATGRRPLEDGPRTLLALCAAATEAVARAISRAVHAAEPSPGDIVPTWRERYGGDARRGAS
jgi:L-aminopeptidase/D-esterase-like protein